MKIKAIHFTGSLMAPGLSFHARQHVAVSDFPQFSAELGPEGAVILDSGKPTLAVLVPWTKIESVVFSKEKETEKEAT